MTYLAWVENPYLHTDEPVFLGVTKNLDDALMACFTEADLAEQDDARQLIGEYMHHRKSVGNPPVTEKGDRFGLRFEDGAGIIYFISIVHNIDEG